MSAYKKIEAGTLFPNLKVRIGNLRDHLTDLVTSLERLKKELEEKKKRDSLEIS